MYNSDYFNIPNNGWTCPKCGRSYAPHVAECVYCNSKIIKYLDSTTTTKPEWMHTDSIYDNEWWKTTTDWEDMLRRTGLLEDD